MFIVLLAIKWEKSFANLMRRTFIYIDAEAECIIYTGKQGFWMLGRETYGNGGAFRALQPYLAKAFPCFGLYKVIGRVKAVEKALDGP
ncbi:hypothetical protein [Arenibacter lacus]|uniref:hypothetical protein n=1 Tax=Arenibacter lacus TaxID=2608629 RepID=UPI00123D8124|nr:hypothetical protein [Arenibacter lacus]